MRKKIDINSLSQCVVNMLKYRCAADFMRLTREDFKLVWCKCNVFAQMTIDNFIFYCLNVLPLLHVLSINVRLMYHCQLV